MGNGSVNSSKNVLACVVLTIVAVQGFCKNCLEDSKLEHGFHISFVKK